MGDRFNAFGPYMKQTFGARVHKVNIDAGFTCPNRDGSLGTSGCIYCNNDSFRPSSCRPALGIGEQVRNGIKYLRGRYGAERFIAYFQAYTNTYAPVDVLERLYLEALDEPSVMGLAIGTRPDCIDEEKLDLLESLAKKHFILVEYGLQSIYDRSLRFINRGHDYDTFLKALAMTNGRGIKTGAHIIVGFPTESREETVGMAPVLSEVGIEFLKVHQLQVVRNTPLADIYEKNPFHVFAYDEYLDFLSDFIERLSPEIVLQRLFATAPDDILIAPHWGRSRHDIHRDIDRRLAKRGTRQGSLYRKEHQRV